MLHLLLIAAAAAPPAVHLDPSRDAALPCPAYAALRSRLAALDPASLSPGDSAGALEVALGFVADAWQLRLERPDGTAALERRLQLDKSDCTMVAESAALVIDRYLEALRAPARARPRGPPERSAAPALRSAPPRSTPVARTEAASAAATNDAPQRATPGVAAAGSAAAAGQPGVPADRSSQVERPATPAAGARAVDPPRAPERASVAQAPREGAPGAAEEPSEPERAQLSLALGPAAWLGLPSDLRAGLWLEAEHPIAPRSADPDRPALAGLPLSLSTRLLLAGTAASSQAEVIDGSARGQISARSLLIAAAAGPCATGWLRACASGFIGARLSSGASSGAGIFAQGSTLLAQPEVGALLSFDRALPARLQLRVELLLGAAPGMALIEVTGGPPRQLSTFDVAGAVLLGYPLF